MQEFPIIFRGDMAAKVHDGTKTQTRRLKGLEEVNADPDLWTLVGVVQANPYFRDRRDGCAVRIACPYGVPGDRLWVRESFWIPEWHNMKPPTCVDTGTGSCVRYADTFDPSEKCPEAGRWVRRPSIRMPRWASRTVLDLLEVRVQRVQEISDEDAIAEGCPGHDTIGKGEFPTHFWGVFSMGELVTPVGEFALLWESINAKRGYGWDVNPWCWCLTFKKVAP
jgi:hypothetical protein